MVENQTEKSMDNEKEMVFTLGWAYHYSRAPMRSFFVAITLLKGSYVATLCVCYGLLGREFEP